MQGVIELIPTTGEAMACRALGTTRGELHRQRLRTLAASIMGPPAPRQPRVSPLSLSQAERQLVLNTLGSERFADTAPASVHATLLDEGCYLKLRAHHVSPAQDPWCLRRTPSPAPPYGLRQTRVAGHRREPGLVLGQHQTQEASQVELLANRYVILDIFSRYVVGWLIAKRESSELAKQLIEDTAQRQNIAPGTLSLHADRGFHACAPNRWLRCWLIWTSPRATAGPTRQTTIPFLRTLFGVILGLMRLNFLFLDVGQKLIHTLRSLSGCIRTSI